MIPLFERNRFLDELFSLEGKVALVTGGRQGIGQVVSLGFAKAGAEIFSFDLGDSQETLKMIKTVNGKAHSLSGDVTSEADVNAAIKAIYEQSGRLDIVFNNAGTCVHKGVFEATVEEWRHVLEVNLTGEYIVARAAGRAMIENNIQGSIINVASMSGTIVNIPQWQASYNASKAGVLHMTRSLAMEWADCNIRVNSISPGYIATPLSTKLPDEWKSAWIPLIPMHRLGNPEELLGAAIYLASDASTYTTGTDIIVDGGYVCI